MVMYSLADFEKTQALDVLFALSLVGSSPIENLADSFDAYACHHEKRKWRINNSLAIVHLRQVTNLRNKKAIKSALQCLELLRLIHCADLAVGQAGIVSRWTK